MLHARATPSGFSRVAVLLHGALAAIALGTAVPCIAANHEIRIELKQATQRPVFRPDLVAIEPGDTVTFISRGHTGQHNIVSDTGLFRCALGCDGEGGNGDPTYADFDAVVAFPEPGTYGYHCAVHGDTGMIVVGDGGPASVPITAGFTGSWYNSAQSGHGFNIEVLANGGLLAYWYVFDAAGNPAWIVAQGEIDGTLAILDAYLVAGGAFPPDFDPGAVTRTLWGTITFTFTDCNQGHAAWDTSEPGYADGEMDMVRLTLPAGLSCP